MSRDRAGTPFPENNEKAEKIRVDLGEGSRETLGRELNLSGLPGPNVV